jgi:hypothetical protein
MTDQKDVPVSAPAPGPPVDPVDSADPETAPSRPVATCYCANCEQDVEPIGKGSCPACGRFLRANVAAAVPVPSPEDKRCAALADELFAERGGRDAVDVITRSRIEEFAVLSVQLEGEAAHRRRLELSTRRERIGGLLRGEAPPLPGVDALPTSARDLHHVPILALERAQGFLQCIVAGGELSEYEQGQYDLLQDVLRGKLAVPPDPVPLPMFNTAQPTPQPIVEPPVAQEPEPPAVPKAEAEPDVWADGQRITEVDVIDALLQLGDEKVDEYRTGKMPKAEAYQIARRRIRAHHRFQPTRTEE